MESDLSNSRFRSHSESEPEVVSLSAQSNTVILPIFQNIRFFNQFSFPSEGQEIGIPELIFSFEFNRPMPRVYMLKTQQE